MDKGWISINRKLQNHWLWQENRPFTKLEAWLDILLTVNHTEQKVMIKNTLYTVERGESIKCLDTWAKRWNWSKSKVRRFFILLKKDSMIVTKNEQKTTRLTVCNYDSYQDARNANETQMKRERNASETQVAPNNNDNNINNNYNNINFDGVDYDLNTVTGHLSFYTILTKNIKNEETWINSLYRNEKIQKGKLGLLIDKFIIHLQSLDVKDRPKKISDFKSHCASWIRLKIRIGEFSEYRTIKAKGSI